MNPLPAQILHCLGVLAAYIVPCLLILVPMRFLTKVPSFVFRKLLHFLAFTCISLMILAARSWQAAALTSILLAVIIYPVLALLEDKPWFANLFVQKSPGEIKRSALLLFFMFAALISVSWGIFGQPHLAAAAILMWGTGDAAAALIGIPFGRHKVHSRFTDGRKSWEGTLAMLLVSFISGMSILLLAQRMTFSQALPAAGIGAVLGAATELFSPSEYDTVTVPVVILAVLLVIVL
ncbi:MAG: hypothetical protein IJG40_01790 [Oscillospiraceae bacterium]|nr:hypothetical protein [Oscillospiraceae bacterium]